ncbi:MAG: PspC domain-containing protein [Gammaproteobacteria bacterium]|nr:PspC domain-containing protein [Gammaproteobacteria bacterium]MDH4256452.1 PspC domain-containing protein [Gammaproteobacteria bacterium]MDH5262236.1 PspC domain-containing protein [Gammaproteobacteria bacterium]
MTRYDTMYQRRFCRNSSRAMIGGVCAGVADYFGFNLKVTRILAVISLLIAMPATLLAYFGTVLLVPSRPENGREPSYDPAFRKALRSNPTQTLGDVRRRYQGLERRLARLERYVTSPQYQLDQEFRNL